MEKLGMMSRFANILISMLFGIFIFAKEFADKDKETQYIQDYIKNVYEFYGFGMWTVVEKASGQVIGRAGVSYREGFSLPELGFMIGKVMSLLPSIEEAYVFVYLVLLLRIIDSENIKILLLVYLIGALSGLLIELINFIL